MSQTKSTLLSKGEQSVRLSVDTKSLKFAKVVVKGPMRDFSYKAVSRPAALAVYESFVQEMMAKGYAEARDDDSDEVEEQEEEQEEEQKEQKAPAKVEARPKRGAKRKSEEDEEQEEKVSKVPRNATRKAASSSPALVATEEKKESPSIHPFFAPASWSSSSSSSSSSSGVPLGQDTAGGVWKQIVVDQCSSGGSGAACAGCNAHRRAADGAFPFGLEWNQVSPTFMAYEHKASMSSSASASGAPRKIAAFDMDSTLVNPKSGAKFPKNRNDWEWWHSAVPAKLQQLYQTGYEVMIFTNQAGVKAGKQKLGDLTGKISDLCKILGFPLFAYMSLDKDYYRKPTAAMWDHMAARLGGVDLAASFYVGDAAGRDKNWKAGRSRDFSVTDRMFAANVGVPFQTPEEFFLNERLAPFNWRCPEPAVLLRDAEAEAKKAKRPDIGYTSDAPLHSTEQELIVCTGSPASGKSSFSTTHFPDHVYVNQDTFKTKAKCLKACREGLQSGKSVIIDNTNPEPSTRAEYVSIANDLDIPVRCFWFTTPRDLAEHLNLYREKMTQGERARVPSIALNMFKSKFKEPKLSEGYTSIAKISFVPKFKDERTKQLFLQRTA